MTTYTLMKQIIVRFWKQTTLFNKNTFETILFIFLTPFKYVIQNIKILLALI